ncbi:hypothetical protein ACFVVA_41255 [Kitasatospora sp. NPDC058048]
MLPYPAPEPLWLSPFPAGAAGRLPVVGAQRERAALAGTGGGRAMSVV